MDKLVNRREMNTGMIRKNPLAPGYFERAFVHIFIYRDFSVLTE